MTYKFSQRLVLTCSFAFVLSVLPSTCVGQSEAGTGVNMVTQFKGKLKSYNRGGMIVTREDGTDVMVQPPEDATSLVFTAPVVPAFLRQGMMVRYEGTFTQAGVATGPIEKIELFQPVTGKLNGHQRIQFTPGVHGERRGPNDPVPATAKVTVVGGLMGLDGSVIMVQAGQLPVRAPVSADTKLEINFNNLSLAQEGDPVNVQGFYDEPDDTKVRAGKITIKVDRVYGEDTGEKPVRTRRKSRRTEKTADAEANVDAESTETVTAE